MSLIEDALRRQEREARESATPPPPYMVQPEGDPAFQGGRSRPSRLLIGGGALLLLVLAGLVAFPMAVRRASPTPAPVAKPSFALPVVPAAAHSVPPAAPTSTVAAAPPVQATTNATPAPLASARTAAAPTGTNAAVAAARIPAAAEPAERVATVKTNHPVSPPPPVVWPDIAIKGTFWSGRRAMVLFSDGTMLEPGATAPNGVQLIGAANDAVKLGYRGQQRLYRHGGGAFLASGTNTASAAPP